MAEHGGAAGQEKGQVHPSEGPTLSKGLWSDGVGEGTGPPSTAARTGEPAGQWPPPLVPKHSPIASPSHVHAWTRLRVCPVLVCMHARSACVHMGASRVLGVGGVCVDVCTGLRCPQACLGLLSPAVTGKAQLLPLPSSQLPSRLLGQRSVFPHRPGWARAAD